MSLPAHRRRGGAAGHTGWGMAWLAWLVTAPAWAQELEPLPGFMLERLELNPGRGSLVVSGGELLAEGALRVSVLGHYQRDPLSVYREGQRLSLVQDRMTGVLMGAYGVLPWLEVGAQLPLVAVQDGADVGEQGLAAPARNGVGSPRLQGRVGLLSQASEDAVDLAVELAVGLPVGSSRALAREAGPSVTGRVMMGGRWGFVAPAVEAGVLVRSSVSLGSALGSQDEVGSEVRVGAGVTTVGHALRGELGLRAGFSPGRTHSTLEALGGVRYAPVATMEVFALGGVGFGAEPGTPRYRALFGVAFTTPSPPEPVQEPEVVYELVTLKPRQRSAPAPEGAEELVPPAEPEAPASEPQLVTLTRERLVLNGQIFFETGSATLPERSRVLDRAAQVLLEHSELPLVVIEGHTDTEGGPTYNQALSRARAEAVRRYLIERGVPEHRLVAQGFGANRPLSSNTTEEGREQNRRAEVLLMLGNPKPVFTESPPP